MTDGRRLIDQGLGDDLVPAADAIDEVLRQRRGLCQWCSAEAVFELIVSRKSSTFGEPIFWDTRRACSVHHDDPAILETYPSALIQKRRLA